MSVMLWIRIARTPYGRMTVERFVETREDYCWALERATDFWDTVYETIVESTRHGLP